MPSCGFGSKSVGAQADREQSPSVVAYLARPEIADKSDQAELDPLKGWVIGGQIGGLPRKTTLVKH